MKRSCRGTSIVEVLVLIVILTSGILWMYTIYNKSQALAQNTANRLQATAIAREGIEVVTNIRATNWINFAADMENCWNVHEYNKECLETWTNPIAPDILIQEGSYIVIWEEHGNDTIPRFILNKKDAGIYGVGDYIKDFRIKEKNGFWVQNFDDADGGYKAPFFTREIQISYNPDWLPPTSCATSTPPTCSESWNPQKMQVKSIVHWMDGSSSQPYQLIAETLLTNWK